MLEEPVSRLVRVDDPETVALWQRPGAEIPPQSMVERCRQGWMRFRRISWPKDRPIPAELARFPFIEPFIMVRADRAEIVVVESDHMQVLPLTEDGRRFWRLYGWWTKTGLVPRDEAFIVVEKRFDDAPKDLLFRVLRKELGLTKVGQIREARVLPERRRLGTWNAAGLLSLKILRPVLATLTADAQPKSTLSRLHHLGVEVAAIPAGEAWRVEELSSPRACCFRAEDMPGEPAVLFSA
ncbi:hypothetical protein ASZ90_000734 [hydrocarbon metagenome]|uniref:Uncharacterized protein n=1 Tax=hydrocarbon metagenome TaxID=938273 RepID=A0A0W8G887_9ZZZZ